MVMSPTGLGPKSDWAGEGQKQFNEQPIRSQSVAAESGHHGFEVMRVSCELVGIQQGREYASRRNTMVCIRYLPTHGEGVEALMFGELSCRVCTSAKLYSFL
jgi:hypothetical protein